MWMPTDVIQPYPQQDISPQKFPEPTKIRANQEQLEVTRELLRSHCIRAQEAQELANQHDEMALQMAAKLAALEREDEFATSSKEVQNSSGGARGNDGSPSMVNRGLLFNQEFRDVDFEFQSLSLDLAPTPSTPEIQRSPQEEVNLESPTKPYKSKYLLTDTEKSFFKGILNDSEDSSNEQAKQGKLISAAVTPVAKQNKAMTFHSAILNTSAHLWPELSGSPKAFLHIYEVAELSGGVHSLLTTFGTGAFHAGVEVYGKEWSFCADPLPSSGTGLDVLSVPTKHPTHQYQETVFLGETSLSPAEVKALIQELESQWLAVDYNALRRNCVTFAETFCNRLHVDKPPARVGALTRGLKMFLFA